MHWFKNSRLFPQRRRIVCLANSRKYGGRCLAGKEFDGTKAGTWIRPVSRSEYEEIALFRQTWGFFRPAQPLDVISIPLREPQSLRFSWQCENLPLGWGLMRKVGRLEWDELAGLVDRGADLWAGASRGVHPRNDRIKLKAAKLLKSSLCLIRPRKFSIRIENNRFSGRRQFRGLFTHRQQRFDLAITDPEVPRRFFDLGQGSHSIEDCYVCISLGEPKEGYCYRLIASVIIKP